MESVETQIAEWRAHVAKAPAVKGHDVAELEGHLRNQLDELDAAGPTADEAFLVAVKRMGELDGVSREFAREHSGRLWKQLFEPDEEAALGGEGWLGALIPAVGAGVATQGARLSCRRRAARTRAPAPGARVPRRGAHMARPEPRPDRSALPRGVLRPQAPARPSMVD